MIVIPDGFLIEIDGQTYEFIGTDEHQTEAGERTDLLVWNTSCSSCGKRTQVITPLVFTAPGATCDDCNTSTPQAWTNCRHASQPVRQQIYAPSFVALLSHVLSQAGSATDGPRQNAPKDIPLSGGYIFRRSFLPQTTVQSRFCRMFYRAFVAHLARRDVCHEA